MLSANSDRTQKWINEVLGSRDEDEIDKKVDLILAECSKTEPPFLSDLIIGADNGGQPILMGLGAREANELEMSDTDRFRWRIQVLCDEWGNKPIQGEFVERVIQQNLYKKEGKPVPATDLSRAKRDGSYAAKYERRVRLEIDEKGCITCGFTSASILLNTLGVHAVTGYAMPHNKPEHSGDVLTTPNGDKLHAWYWRYKEMDSKMYDALPKIGKLDITEKTKRGIGSK